MAVEDLIQKLREASQRFDDRIAKELKNLKENPKDVDVEKIKETVQTIDSEEKGRAIFEYFNGDFGNRLSKDENKINTAERTIQVTGQTLDSARQEILSLTANVNTLINDLQILESITTNDILDVSINTILNKKLGGMIPVVYGYIRKSNTTSGEFAVRRTYGPRGVRLDADSGISNNGIYTQVNLLAGHGVTMANTDYTVVIGHRRQNADDIYIFETRFVARTTATFNFSAVANTDNSGVNIGTSSSTSVPPEFSFAIFGQVDSIVP
jgi:hypothetical protein